MCNQRVSILVMGYILLLLQDLVHLGFGINYLRVIIIVYGEGAPRWNLVEAAGTVFFLLVDITFCVTLLVGTHKENRSLLRPYSWYGIVGVIVTSLLSAYAAAAQINLVINHPSIRQHILADPLTYIEILWFGLANIVIRICLLVFVKREMRHLHTETESLKNAITRPTELNNI